MPFYGSALRFGVVLTGGTVLMERSADGLLVPPKRLPEAFERLLKEAGINAEVKVAQAANIDSVNARQDLWISVLEQIIVLKRAGLDEILVVHGTDSMEYTGAAVDLFAPYNRIAFAGAQRDPDHPDPDGPRNITDAFTFLLEGGTRQNAIVFGGKIVAASRAAKLKPEELDAFDSPGLELLGTIEKGKLSMREKKPGEEKAVLTAMTAGFVDGIAEMVINPLLSPDVLIPILESNKTSGLLLHSYQSGAMPDDFDRVVMRAVELGKPVCIRSRNQSADIRISNYASGADLENLGLIRLPDMTEAMSLVKLSASIAEIDQRPVNKEGRPLTGLQRISAIRRQLYTEIAGEFATDQQTEPSQLAILRGATI